MVRPRTIATNTFLLTALVVVANLLIVQPTYSADITVTVFNDEFNENGDCSLREAVEAANENIAIGGCAAGDPENVGADNIILAAGTYTLSITCDFNDLSGDEVGAQGGLDFGNSCGDLDIYEDVVINGAGVDATIISVQPAPPSEEFLDVIEAEAFLDDKYYRVFDINDIDEETAAGIVSPIETCADECAPGLQVTLSNMTVSGGEEERGGAVRTDSGNFQTCEYTQLTLTNFKATDNLARESGGAISSYGQLIVSNSEFDGNDAGDEDRFLANGIGYSDTEGGAIHLLGPESLCSGAFVSTISTSTITNNRSLFGDGGGVYNNYNSNLDITDTTIDNNGATERGAGIFNGLSNLNIVGGSISRNAGVFFQVQEAEVEFDEEPRVEFGGGIYNVVESFGEIRPRGLEKFAAFNVTVTDTTIENNKARFHGGGIANVDRFDQCESAFSLDIEISGCAESDLDLEPTTLPESSFTVSGATINGNTLEPNQTFGKIRLARFQKQGAGIYNGRYAGKFFITDSTIAGNVGGVTGGGIDNDWVMEISGSTINNNATDAPGVFQRGDVEASEVRSDFFIDSFAGGGGVNNNGSLIMTNSTVSANTTYGIGGGVRNSMSEDYYYTYLETNREEPASTPFSSPTPFNDDDDDFRDDDDDFDRQYDFEPLPVPGAQLRNVTVTLNKVLDFEFPEFSDEPIDRDNFEAQQRIYNSLIVNNGGGVATDSGPIRLRNTIVAVNEDESLENIIDDLFLGMGIALDPSPFPTFGPSPFPTATPFPEPDFDAVASVAADCWAKPVVDEFFCEDFSCEDFTPVIISEQHNIIGDNTGCADFESVENLNMDKVGTGEAPIDPLLGPLADNGGPTETHALLDDSPAIDMGNMMGSVVEGAIIDVDPATFACEDTDQRGTARPQDGDLDGTATCDIGAFERVREPDPTPTPTATPTPEPTATATPEPDPVVCEEVDITETQFALDGSANEAAALAKRVRRMLRRRTGRRNAGRAQLRRVRELRSANWGFAWELPPVVFQNCTGATEACVEVSNVENLTAYINNANEMSDLIRTMVNRLRRAGVGRKRRRRFLRSNASILAEAVQNTESVPATTTACTE